MGEIPFNPKSPFTRQRALTAGLSDADLTGGGYHQLFWGVYIARSVAVTLVVRSLAALMVAPTGAMVSHHTAASLGRHPTGLRRHPPVHADGQPAEDPRDPLTPSLAHV